MALWEMNLHCILGYGYYEHSLMGGDDDFGGECLSWSVLCITYCMAGGIRIY